MPEQTVAELIEEMKAALFKLVSQSPGHYPEVSLDLDLDLVSLEPRFRFKIWSGHHTYWDTTLTGVMAKVAPFDAAAEKREEVVALQSKLEAAQKELAELEAK